MPATAPPPPTDAELKAALGKRYPLWTEIIASAGASPEWKYYGAKLGFTLKLIEKKRNLFFMAERSGDIIVSFIFGEKAVARALAGDLDEELKQLFRDAPKYPEGRGLRLSIEAPEDIARVRRLLEIKRES